jgi:hypothetical protein
MAMKMYKVFVEDREYFVGKIEMEYLVIVFGDRARVEEITLPDQSSSATIGSDE